MGCDSCVHWRRLDYEDPRYRGVVNSDDDPRADEDRSPASWGSCVWVSRYNPSPMNPEGDGDVPGRLPAPRAFTVDASNYYSALVTRSDFGCVEHTPSS